MYMIKDLFAPQIGNHHPLWVKNQSEIWLKKKGEVFKLYEKQKIKLSDKFKIRHVYHKDSFSDGMSKMNTRSYHRRIKSRQSKNNQNVSKKKQKTEK